MILCADPSSLLGQGCQERHSRRTEGALRHCGIDEMWPRRGSGGKGVLEAGILLLLEGADSQKGTDRVGNTQIPLAAVLEPSDWLSEVWLGGGLPIWPLRKLYLPTFLKQSQAVL